MTGLTAAAYLSKAGYKILICEKEKKVGGLVNSFDFKGFTFDGGIRAIENSGIVFPMLLFTTLLPWLFKYLLASIPDVYQAGQWSYSPSGLPIAILTGKLAADKIAKPLK